MDLVKHIEDSFQWAELEVSKLNQEILDIHGITSNKVRCFLNNICNLDDATYLEVGVFRGATFCSALYGNDTKAIAIDNWSSPYLMPSGISQKMNSYYKMKTEDPKEEFLNNVKKFTNVDNVDVYRASYLSFDFNKLPKVNIVFYDGETKYFDIYHTIKNITPIMADETILIVDDWNWQRDVVEKVISEVGYSILHQKKIYTQGEDSKDFWNGLGIFLIGK
jgi:asparagine N-glycosylation enzyme membrane subunit Stt3